MSYDTPGGSVTNVDELAKAVRAGKAIKPIVAYVGGAAASAGYWLASQSTEIVIADTALLGSIGVRAALQDTSKRTPRPDVSNSFPRNPREANGPLNRRRASAHSAHD
ncbi:hypothetical protein HGG76_15195 [Ochrobactrum tritici]|uniref:Peptidase S49 domain-containing protein n=1 Tax=Brucella tritici TaxID=94626 RepID=A0A7X6FQU5_9HYPH|nr:hypothetical protein [Brucella tritici]